MSINLNTNTTFIKSEDIKVFPCANRGWNGEGNPYDIESKLNTERNNILALGSNPYNSYIISYENSTLKFVLHGYYFEINRFETEEAAAAAVYAKIKLTPTTIAGTTTTLVLSDVDTAINGTNDSSLDLQINNEYYFKGLQLLTTALDEANDYEANNYLDISSSIKRPNSFIRKISTNNSNEYSEEYIMFLGKFEEDSTNFKPNLKAFLPVFENTVESTEEESLESGITFPNNVSIKGPNTRVWGNVTLHKSNPDAQDNFIVNTNTTTINSETFKVKDRFNIDSNGITNSLPTTLNNTLNVANDTTLKKALTVDGSTNLNNTLTVKNGTTLKGSATLNSTLAVTGATTLKGTLKTTSSTTLGNDSSTNTTTINDKLIANNTTSLMGVVSLNDTLTVSGKTTLNGALQTTSDTTLGEKGATPPRNTIINDNLWTSKSIQLGEDKTTETLEINNITTFKGNTKVDKGLVITANNSGLANYTDNALTVEGTSKFNKTVEFSTNANLTVNSTSTFNNYVSIKDGYNLSWGTDKTTINATSLSTSTISAGTITSAKYELLDSTKFELTPEKIAYDGSSPDLDNKYGKVKGLWLDSDNYINLSTTTVFTYNSWVETTTNISNISSNAHLIVNRTNPDKLYSEQLIIDETYLTTSINSEAKCFLGFDAPNATNSRAINLMAGKINQKLLPNTVLQIDTTAFDADVFGQKTMFPVRDWTSSSTAGLNVITNTAISKSTLSLPLLFGYNTVNLTADILPGIQNTATRYSKKLRFYPEYKANVSALYLDGLMYATTFIATSDERKKENIINYNPKNSILDLPVHEFDFKETKQHDIGCIAQELKELFPELVKEDSEGYLAIQETKLIYPLLLEVKKLKEKIEELEKKI